MKKRILAGILSFVIALGGFPTGIYGAETAALSEASEGAVRVQEAVQEETAAEQEAGPEMPEETGQEPNSPETEPEEIPDSPQEEPAIPKEDSETEPEVPEESGEAEPDRISGNSTENDDSRENEASKEESEASREENEEAPVRTSETDGIGLKTLKAVYEGTEYLLYEAGAFEDNGETLQKNFDLTLPSDCKGRSVEIQAIPYEAPEEGISAEDYRIFIADQEAGGTMPCSYLLSGQEEQIAVRISYREQEPVIYTISVHPEQAERTEYLDRLEVYSNANGVAETSRQELVRHEELDEQFGGTVYTVDYSSVSSSGSFYVMAALSPAAPENSGIQMSAYTVNGEKEFIEIPADSYDKGLRYKLAGTVFAAGPSGGKRGVYTIVAGNETEQQIYKIVVCRTLDLASIGCYHPEDTDRAKNLLNPVYDRTIREYTVGLSDAADAVNLIVRPFSQSWYGLKLNGVPMESTDPYSVALTDEVTDIVLSMEQENTYSDPEYAGMTYKSSGEYHIAVTKKVSASADFEVVPGDAAVSLYDARGVRAEASLSQPLHFGQLMEGETYSYYVSCYGYISQQGTFCAETENKLKIELEPVDSRQEEISDKEWWNYRNSEENNGITNIRTPVDKMTAVQKWSAQLGGEWSSSATPPLILDGYLYTAAGRFVYKLNKETGEIAAVSEELAGDMVFALNSLTYGEGMIFAQVGNGQIQALSASTLKSLWISEPIGGQTISPISYKDGYIYTGTWNSETLAGAYFCLSVTDEDPLRGDEIKYCTWKYSHKGGFYWAGAYAARDYLVFGSDDGSDEGEYTNTSILYSVSSRNGILIDKLENLKGDIRTSIVYENGYVYFATKGGYLYRIQMGADGSFGDVASYDLGGMATASPVIYKGRIYVGVCGKGGQFSSDGGHHFDVLQETADGISLAYSVEIPGYPQAAALLSNAYENEDFDGDGKPDGRVYLYFTYNAFPGGIYMLEDAPGRTQGKAEALFEPDTPQQQHCISTICVDREGTLYYKNDSCYLMAVGTNSAYLENIEAEADAGKISWDRAFRSSLSGYRLTVGYQAKRVRLSLKFPEHMQVTVNGKPYAGAYDVALDEEQHASVEILVSDGNRSRSYQIEIQGAGRDADLSNLVVSSENAYADTEGHLALTPEFYPEVTSYTTEEYQGDHAFLNIFVKTQEADAMLEVIPVQGVKRAQMYLSSTGSEGHIRIAVYFADEESRAAVDLGVTSGDGAMQKTYRVNLIRTDEYPPILSEERVVRRDESYGEVIFSSNETGRYFYQAVKTGETPSPDFPAQGELMLQGENKIRIETPGGEGRDIYLIAEDSFGHRMESPLKLELAAYRRIPVAIRVTPQNAVVKVQDRNGNVQAVQNGRYELLAGNEYLITITLSGYVSITETIRASSEHTSYEFHMVSSRSSDADLKQLYVSSSSKYGSGVLKLSPKFSKNTTNYSAVYTAERGSLNVWPETADEKASVKIYALGGVKGSTVQRDETIRESTDSAGRKYWPVYFAEGQFAAKVRICVTAEDGTVKNTILTLGITDQTAPVLKKVSASRISADKASVVFKSSEKGRYYYAVADAKGPAPSLDSSGEGIEILAGTTTITLNHLSRGEKDVYIVVKDHAGNISKTLIIRIPDSRSSWTNGSLGQGQSGSKITGNSPVLKKKEGVSGEGSMGKLQKAGDSQVKHSNKQTDSGEQSKEKKKTSLKNVKSEKDKKAESGEKSEEEKSEAEGGETASDDSSYEKTKENKAEAFGTEITEMWKEWHWTYKLAVILAGLGLAYLLFWWRARCYYRRKMLVRLQKANI